MRDDSAFGEQTQPKRTPSTQSALVQEIRSSNRTVTARNAGKPGPLISKTCPDHAFVEPLWIHAFQIEGFTLDVQEGAQEAISQLTDASDDWDAATWFATPNPWLCERAPMVAVAEGSDAVAQAARIARFIEPGEALPTQGCYGVAGSGRRVLTRFDQRC